jgi:hypothetical protein
MSQRGIANQKQLLAQTSSQQQQRLKRQQQQRKQQLRKKALEYGSKNIFSRSVNRFRVGKQKTQQIESQYNRIKQQQQLRKRQQQQKGRKVQAQESRKYMKAILQMAEQSGEPIKFTLKFKKFMNDLGQALRTLITNGGKSRAGSPIIFSVGTPEGYEFPAMIDGKLRLRPYSQKQMALAVSPDDKSSRALIEFTIRPMNTKQQMQFRNKRQQKAQGSMSKSIDENLRKAEVAASTVADATSRGFKKTKQFFGKLKLF